ncbi:hypothetical protein [Arthrobacter sp. A2-55]|uniref:hypothetical protein n=1 Tax=Arthrobacter sp. A2-55 TaxID=2897337 RepID=UPI0021CDB63F|nr:hypothetical protein [Arthrobacter sp. A2-55]MCU6481958.1 hypothetical protein [Arthrobacter sp. A2-55]
MSTPYIYRLAEGTDLFDFLEDFKAAMNPIRDRLDARMLTEKAMRIIDQAALRGEPLGWASPWDQAWRRYRTEQSETSRYRREFDPNSLSVTIGRDPETRRLLARLVIDGHREYPTAFAAMDGVEPYWDRGDLQFDEDDNIIPSEQELAWVRTAGRRRADESMFSYSLRTETDSRIMDLADTAAGRAMILAEALSFESRVAEHAQQSVIDGMLAGQPMDGMGPFMAAYRRVRGADLSTTEAVISERLTPLTASVLFLAAQSPVSGPMDFKASLAEAVAHDIAVNHLNEYKKEA